MILYGYGGHGRQLADYLESMGITIKAVFDDKPIQSQCPYPLFDRYDGAVFPENKVIISIGDNKIRQKIALKLEHDAGTLIHPSALVSSKAGIKKGTVVLARAVVQANVAVGEFCIINTGAIVEHDCLVGDYVHLAPGVILCGGVEIGKGSLIGAGSVVGPGVKIGASCTIGAGSVIVSSVEDGWVVAGNPAVKLNKM